jgi:hypothetical protein
MSRIEPPAFESEIFDLTMKGLEAGLKVGDIATYGFLTCEASDNASEVLERPAFALFDCIPVRDGERVIGVLERNGRSVSGTARSSMRPLDDTLLVAADEALKGFIPLLVESPHRLVVRGARIDGIVTSSDVHKLPVRLLAFALVTHLEMTMTDVIRRTSSEDEWLGCLGERRRGRVLQKLEDLRARNFDPPLLELTDFCDKRDILAKKGLFGSEKAQAIRDFRQIEELRNSVAHAATYAQDAERFREFVDLLGLAEAWIRRLSGSGSSSDQPLLAS